MAEAGAYGARTDLAFFALLKEGRVSGAYYLFGVEEYSKERALLRVKGLLNPSVLDMNYSKLRAPNAEAVIAAAETMPFFDERRVVVAEETPSSEYGKLTGYLPQVPESTVLLFLQRGDANKSNGLFVALSKEGRAVDFAAYDEAMATTFVLKRASEHGVSIDQFTARNLVTMVGTDLFTLESAILKAGAYAGYGAPVSEKHLRACVVPNVEYRVFSVLDKLVAGNKKAAITELLGMLDSGESAMGLASFFEGRFKQMLAAKELLLSGLSDDAAAKRLGGSPYAAKMTLKNAKRMSLDQLRSCVIAFGNVDYYQKQGRMQDKNALLLAVLQNFQAPAPAQQKGYSR